MQTKFRFFRYLAYTLEILVLFIIQQTPDFPALLGARPFLILPVLFSIAMLEDEFTGLGFGVFIGLLMDISCGYVLGFHAILLGILGYFVGLLAVNLVKTNVLTVLLLTAAGVAIVGCLEFVFFYCLRKYGDMGYAFQYHYLPMMAYTFLPTPILYFFNKAFAIAIRERE